MERLKTLRTFVDAKLLTITDLDKRKSHYVHLYGVSLSASLIAKKRGENPELACMAAMLHDLYAYLQGSYEDHAHRGAAYAKEVLSDLQLTTPEETQLICDAIFTHDDLNDVDAPQNEILKDADVMHHTFDDPTKPVKSHEQARYDKLCLEFGLK